MKRFLSLILCLCLLCLCGCGGKDAPAAGDSANPITAAYAESETAVDHAYFPDSTENAVYVIFTAEDNLSGVQLTALEVTEFGYGIGEELFAVETMGVEETLLAPLVFYGDMTAYGIAFADSNGAYRNYAVTISGEDGSLMLQEFAP